MTSLLKKLFVTSLVACSIGATTSTVAFAAESNKGVLQTWNTFKTTRTTETDEEIEAAKFGGFDAAISGNELENPYHIEVEPHLHELYEAFYRSGTYVKKDGTKDYTLIFENLQLFRKK